MADVKTLFDELKVLSPDEAKELSEQLKAQMPQREPETDASDENEDDAPAEE